MSKLFQGRSIQTGQYVNPERQTKKLAMHGEKMTGKQFRKKCKEARKCR